MGGRVDGPEAMGKTEAAKQRAQTVVRLNRERELQLVTAARFYSDEWLSDFPKSGKQSRLRG